MNQVIEFNSRTLIVQEMGVSKDTTDLLSSGSFLAMLPAYSDIEVGLAIQLAPTLIELGCIEICCVGTQSPHLHDKLDYLFEERQAPVLVTTSFVEVQEGSEYFIFGADGAEAGLLIAFVSDHEEIVSALLKSVSEV